MVSSGVIDIVGWLGHQKITKIHHHLSPDHGNTPRGSPSSDNIRSRGSFKIKSTNGGFRDVQDSMENRKK
jgi:hypothetical protein